MSGRAKAVAPEKRQNYDTYTQAQKMDAILAFMDTGSVTQASKISGVKFHTLRLWRKMDWWKEAEQELREELNRGFESKASDIALKAMDQLQDRLVNGDAEMNRKTGEITRIPVKASVANQVTKDMLHQKQSLERINSKQILTEDNVDQMLQKLKEEFLKFSKAKEIKEIPNELA